MEVPGFNAQNWKNSKFISQCRAGLTSIQSSLALGRSFISELLLSKCEGSGSGMIVMVAPERRLCVEVSF